MSLYQCEECGCIENTALGWYHGKDRKLCSACGPAEYSDGTPTKCGKWHNKFERTFFPKGTMETDDFGNIRKIKTGSRHTGKK